MRACITVVGCLALAGCIGIGSGNQAPTSVIQPGPVINLPAPEAVNQEETKADIAKAKADIITEVSSSSNSTLSNMTGAVNVSVSKLAERLTGMENNLENLKLLAESSAAAPPAAATA